MLLAMKMCTFFALCILVAVLSKVDGHAGLAFPYTWTDVNMEGGTGKFYLGCKPNNMMYNNKQVPPFKNKKQVLDGDPEQVLRRLSTPGCYWLFFNDQETWKTGYHGDGKDIRRIPEDMRGLASNFKTEKFAKERARCYGYKFSNEKTWGTYMTDWYCSQPWMEPGRANITSPCGVQGGNEGYAPPPWARKAQEYTYPGAPVTTWTKGNPQKVIWDMHANHGGGYSYRLCKTPAEGIVGLTEECFQQTPLKFVGKTQLRPQGSKGWKNAKLPQTTVGTWPKGSMWRGVSNLELAIKAKRLMGLPEGKLTEIKDMVMVPAHLDSGDYVLSWRWDTDRSNQVWSGCSNIKIQ